MLIPKLLQDTIIYADRGPDYYEASIEYIDWTINFLLTRVTHTREDLDTIETLNFAKLLLNQPKKDIEIAA